MTTTGEGVPDERDGWFVDETGLARPWHEWMAANSIDLDRIPMWPKVEIDRDAGTMWVEHFVNARRHQDHLERVCGRPVLIFDRCPTEMVQMSMPHPPGELLWEVYTREHAGAMLDRHLVLMARNGATVVRAAAGSTLLFVSKDPWFSDTASQAAAMQTLEAMLPGITVGMVHGADTIIHQRPGRP